jgi:xanthine dehydrogenase YagR molybdenum-binding subunit
MTTALERAVGAPVARIEGVAKVRGVARYAAEYPLPALAYGSVVASRIARGRVRRIDSDAALDLPGVIAVLDHRTAPRLHDIGDEAMQFQDDVVHYRGQPIALVVAETLEQARAAADALPRLSTTPNRTTSCSARYIPSCTGLITSTGAGC